VTATLSEIRTRTLSVPLLRPWGSDVRAVHVIVVDVRDSDGATGHGFAWTPSRGAAAVHAMLDEDIAPFALGMDADPSCWRELWEHVHEAGGGGVTTIALAGVDTALWDLAARRVNAGLPELLGRTHDRQPAYGSGVNLHYSLDDLVAQARRWVDAGFSAVKVKVGRPKLGDDVERIGAVRDAIGDDRKLMVDANQRWELDEATRAVEQLAAFNIEWLEEPLRADDIAGHAELRRRTGVRIALGENVHTWHRFRDALDAQAVDIVQPNVVRVGGITPFLEIAKLARERKVELAPHLLPELSAQIAFALPETTWVEDVEDASFEHLGALVEPSGVVIADGWAGGGPRNGLGLRFKQEAS